MNLQFRRKLLLSDLPILEPLKNPSPVWHGSTSQVGFWLLCLNCGDQKGIPSKVCGTHLETQYKGRQVRLGNGQGGQEGNKAIHCSIAHRC